MKRTTKKKPRKSPNRRSSGSSEVLPSLIGVIHLPPLAGSPGAVGLHPAEALQRAGQWAVREAQYLEKAGFEGLVIENFGDAPFYRDRVPPETVAAMAVIAGAVRECVRVPLGINILRNDAHSALAVASVTACDWIRVNVLSGVAATDQGWIEGRAAELIRERSRLGAEVAILADVHVKHARTFSSDSIALAVEEAVLRAGATGVIVTGETTGRSVDLEHLKEASRAARAIGASIFVGSGATSENLAALLKWADGVIVGSALRIDGRAGAPLDPKRVQMMMRAYKKKK